MSRHWELAVIVAMLAAASILVLRSVAPSLALPQAVFFGLGAVVWWATSRLNFGVWQRLSPVLYVGLLLLLVVTMIIGGVTRGSTRWISIGGLFNVQGSQLAVPVVAMYLSWWVRRGPVTSFKKFVMMLALLAGPAALIFIEPDLDTTIVFLAATGVMVFLATAHLRYILGSVALGLIGIAFAWMFLLKPYQQQRITSFINPTVDPQGAGYNARQSLIAVGSGQILGRGLGQGVQSHLRFLPERQTDFVFASLAEELGLVGSVGVIGLYGLLCFQIWRIGSHAQDWSAQLFCWGCCCLIAFQASVNISMNMGLIPVSGLTLPFLSYGGSSVLSLCFMLGLVHSIQSTQRPQLKMAIT